MRVTDHRISKEEYIQIYQLYIQRVPPSEIAKELGINLRQVYETSTKLRKDGIKIPSVNENINYVKALNEIKKINKSVEVKSGKKKLGRPKKED